jgi:predicted nucleotidyltransferase
VADFEGLWQRRRAIRLAADVEVHVPAIPDLILTKRIGSRPKDLEDIRLLEILQEEEPE